MVDLGHSADDRDVGRTQVRTASSQVALAVLMAGCVHTGWRDTQFPADCSAAVVELAGTAIPGLRQFRPSPHTPRAGYGNQGTDEYPYPVYWVKLPQRSGLIDFGGDDWVYIAIVSAWHDDEDSGRPDITMAVDSDGGLWLNRERICGGGLLLGF